VALVNETGSLLAALSVVNVAFPDLVKGIYGG
jgi:hypothetical protein